jgi:anti-sigma-K factor RskA
MLDAEDNKELRQYLLGDLTQPAQQRVEQRLLTEDDFFEELLLGEEELIDDYVGGNLSGEDRLKFERHFLSTPERHRQLRFARAFTRYAARSNERVVSESVKAQALAPPPQPIWAERFRAFWNRQTRALRPAVAVAMIAVIAAALWLVIPPTSPPKTFQTIILTAGVSSRAEGAQASKVRLPLNADALKINLMLPERATPAASYRVELMNGSVGTRSLEVAGRDAQSVSVVIPAAQLARGQYALRLFVTDPDGTEHRVSADVYLFNVE